MVGAFVDEVQQGRLFISLKEHFYAAISNVSGFKIDMRKTMLDLLACPIDKHYPLELYEITTREDDDSGQDKTTVIIDGVLFCSKCFRFYPVVEEIPILLPDELRERQNDIGFLQKWRDKLPAMIINQANPWHL
jgi:uncharacterized protein YbaR (Trm112 family)